MQSQSSVVPWSVKQTEDLIKYWEKYPGLYDIKHQDYTKTTKKKQYVEDIGKLFVPPRSGKQVAEKLKSLRTIFLQNKKRQKESASGVMGEMYIPTWMHFQSLQFLQKSRRKKDEREECVSPSLPTTAHSSQLETALRRNDTTRTTPPVRLELLPLPRLRTIMPKALDIGSVGEIKSEQIDVTESHVNGEDEGDEPPRWKQTRTDNDECSTYGRYIADEIRSMTDYQRNVAKLRVQQVIFEIKNEQYCNPDAMVETSYDS